MAVPQNVLDSLATLSTDGDVLTQADLTAQGTQAAIVAANQADSAAEQSLTDARNKQAQDVADHINLIVATYGHPAVPVTPPVVPVVPVVPVAVVPVVPSVTA